MKFIEIITEGKKITITVEEKYFFGFLKRKVNYISNRIITGTYREWLRVSDLSLVPDRTSLQLDAFNRYCEKT